MYGIHRPIGSWHAMGHGAAFAQFLYDGGDRGEDQFGSINWLMGMAYRNVAGGRLGFRGMLSFESWTVRGCGYPDLLATGERCDGEPIHDRQHQHDLFMELAAQYDRPLTGPCAGRYMAGRSENLRSGPSRIRTEPRRCRTCSRPSPITGWMPRTSRSVSSPQGSTATDGRPKPRRSTAVSLTKSELISISRRWIHLGTCVVPPHAESRVADLGWAPHGSGARRRHGATNRRQTSDGISHLPPRTRRSGRLGNDGCMGPKHRSGSSLPMQSSWKRISRSPTGIPGLGVSKSSRRPHTISIYTTSTARKHSPLPSCKAATPDTSQRGRV